MIDKLSTVDKSGGRMADLTELRERRAMYIAAEKAVVTSGQTYAIEGLSLTRADLDQIRDMISQLDREISNELDRQAGRTAGVALPKWS